ncbi:GH92 family glycosyl hydrolase [Burkholderia singularis]|uniref:GH92 family glycosyl hydrolase n=1 Tax=Burkholderia singularis TaxID=1503053 RepID=UPI0009EB888B|nr:GH92 family glycosyl hydrolase [Burkholderia singularis]
MRRSNHAALAVLAASLLLAGCNGDDGTASPAVLNAANNRAGAETSAPAAPGEAVRASANASDVAEERNVQMALTQYVNPFIGTANASVRATDPVPAGERGGTFPGATTPFGMVQWSPMTPSIKPGGGKDTPVGYVYTENTIIGFPLTQMSGSGCDGNSGELPIMPTFDPAAVASNLVKPVANFKHENETASPGYYRVVLNDGIKAELTATTRTGFGRFTFPANTQPATLVIDATRTNTKPATQGSIGYSGNDALSGSTVGGGFCGARNYTVYFYIQFDRNIDKSATDLGKGNAKVRFAAKSGPVLMKVALSYVSVANAKQNLDAENPAKNWDFDGVRKAADQTWNNRLNTIQVSGGSMLDKRKFYTALYHSMLSPNVNSDVNGEYIGFDQKIHRVTGNRTQYVNYSNWDTYRSLMPLLGMLFPRETSDMLQSLVTDAEQCGAIPRWSPINVDQGIMPGDSGVPAVVGGYAFGATRFDTASALKYMKLAGNKRVVRCGSTIPRDGDDRMNDHLTRGYVSLSRGWWAGSLTPEFSTVDFAIASFAKSLGDETAYRQFLARAAQWKNMYNVQQKQILPRYDDGSWNLSPVANQDMVEGNAEQYTWMMTHDTRELFALSGGNDAVVKRLDAYFSNLNAGMSPPHFYIGNEPSFSSPWLYNWAGAPWRTQKVVRDIINGNADERIDPVFNDGPGGLPGNDDLGAVSSWYVWAALGAYPAIQSVGGLALHSPVFDKAVVRWADGHKQLIINTTGNGAQSRYIQSATLNGAALDAPWVWLKDDLRKVARLDIALGSAPSQWGAAAAERLPSYGLDGFVSIADALNNVGTGARGSTPEQAAEGNTFDGSGARYSRDALAAIGVRPNSRLTLNGLTFAWPDSKTGLDNMIVQGQTITFATPVRGKSLSLLGSASNGPSTGKLVVTYADGTQATLELTFDDWTLNGGSRQPGPYNTVVLTTPTRLRMDGTEDGVPAKVFQWTQPLDPARPVKSVTFPYQVDRGRQHVFAMTVGG